ncbi:MAG: tRNA (adenosine(37)-N6)-threonylcarbamoyltransferase complex dimerization subunit type 1 TsaB [Saprospiraceae bacterium]|nr:tRNA (adenosine(37)-N6)-threonylcarbamoyltransferase complex dimerization subunit type 1 TsaB [Saprospiraceae bacterium]
MATILQLETSGEVCSVAISKDAKLLTFSESYENNSHTGVITILIKQCLDDVNLSLIDIDAVAVSGGPGSYTSLRVGVATAKGICYGTGCRLIVIDSLFILASGINIKMIKSEDVIIPMIDARRMEVYTSIFNNKLECIFQTESVILEENCFDKVLSSSGQRHICGSGALKYVNMFPSERVTLHHQSTSAKFMTEMAHRLFKAAVFTDLAYYSPYYFKAPNITKSLKKLF